MNSKFMNYIQEFQKVEIICLHQSPFNNLVWLVKKAMTHGKRPCVTELNKVMPLFVTWHLHSSSKQTIDPGMGPFHV